MHKRHAQKQEHLDDGGGVRLPLRSRSNSGIEIVGWVIVDPTDAETLKGKRLFMAGKYPALSLKRDGRWAPVRLHRWIAGLADSPGVGVVDHEDRNPLNARRSNLRICQHGQDENSRFKRRGSKSTPVGVTAVTVGRTFFQSRVCIDGRRHWCGEYCDASDAAFARDAFLRSLDKPSSVLNDPNQTEGSVTSAWLQSHPVVQQLFDIEADEPFPVGLQFIGFDNEKAA
jgi:hypothetical protein